MSGFAEIGVTTNYSFLHGAAHPREFIERAAALGYAAVGIADRNTLAGVVRAYAALEEHLSSVIPAKAGTQLSTDAHVTKLDSRLRGDDG